MKPALQILPLVLTQQQVAEALNVSVDTVQKLVREGKLPEVSFGGNNRGRKRYRRRDVERLAEKGWKWE